ncbi:HK97 gp10 family phage protein [Alcaligenaceae bacterium]|nr:HK97 gp10 family phage protein [Alcaligenaceae bacterium]
MKTSMHMSGLRELGQAFAALNDDIQKKAGRNAVSAGANVIKKEAKKLVPVLAVDTITRNPGTIKKNIRSKAVKKKDGTFEARVWVKGLGAKKISAFKASTGNAAKDNPDDPFYWHFVEFGTAKAPAQPFMRPAFEQQKVVAAEKIKSNLLNRINKEAARIGKTIGKA